MGCRQKCEALGIEGLESMQQVVATRFGYFV